MQHSGPSHSGEHIGKVTPVPIPNTEVKLFEPMIVPTSVKVGIAGFLKTLCRTLQRVFLCAHPRIHSKLEARG